MSGSAARLSFKVVSMLVAIPVSKLITKATVKAWVAARPEDPPTDPKAVDTNWADALVWAGLTGLGTAAGNLAMLCRHHHQLKHQTRWRVRQTTAGALEWTSPTGRRTSTRPEPPPATVHTTAHDLARLPGRPPDGVDDTEPEGRGTPPGDPDDGGPPY